MSRSFPKDAEYVWAKQTDTGTGHQRPITRAMYEFSPESWELMTDHPATDAGGNPLPAKNKTSVAAAAAKKATSSGQKAESPKEKS
jgi:hypothetical protein